MPCLGGPLCDCRVQPIANAKSGPPCGFFGDRPGLVFEAGGAGAASLLIGSTVANFAPNRAHGLSGAPPPLFRRLR